MGIRSVPATNLQYYLVSYDKDGRERQDDPDGLMSAEAERAIREDNVTDVVDHDAVDFRHGRDHTGGPRRRARSGMPLVGMLSWTPMTHTEETYDAWPTTAPGSQF